MVALPARVSGRPHDVQPGAVAAGPARGVRRGAGARSVSRSRPEAGRRADAGGRRVHPPELLPRAAPAHDRDLSALRGAAGAAGRRRARCRAGARRSRRASPRTTCATCRSGTSWPGSTRSIWTATAASARSWRRGAISPRTTRRSLRDVELELLNQVIPEYRAAAERGQVEISTSPFYHPILPLLCDTDVYLRTHPGRRRAAAALHASGGRGRATRARGRCHERLFGRRPVGLWPSEGSVSDAMVPLVAEAGFRWMATDELILARTLGTTFARDAGGRVDQPERLYAPYRVEAARRARRVRIPRSRAVRSDRLRVRGLAGRRRGRRFRGAARRSRAPVRGPDRRRRGADLRSSSTARTPGSTSKAAAARSCARSMAGSRHTPSSGR